jgi:alkanesulfonate monooxygenase SsuD/methylene tetrahydromethanopterin reductase-like flavin-dependent oxidoreductase (luciferase family)
MGVPPRRNWRRRSNRRLRSLFVLEHTHIPVSRNPPPPTGGELAPRYAHLHDPFVALSFAAAVTKKLRIGTGPCLMMKPTLGALI